MFMAKSLIGFPDLNTFLIAIEVLEGRWNTQLKDEGSWMWEDSHGRVSDTARVVIIGGGVVGVSALYHLARQAGPIAFSSKKTS
jgi:hypothetical protein